MEKAVSLVTHRGRAYRCNTCPYEAEKARVVAYLFKYHTKLDRVPFYCSLCLFKTDKEKELKKHVTGYVPHKQRVEELRQRGEVVDEELFLKAGLNPINASLYMTQLSKLQSEKVWQKRSKEEKNTTERDLLQEAMSISKISNETELLPLQFTTTENILPQLLGTSTPLTKTPARTLLSNVILKPTAPPSTCTGPSVSQPNLGTITAGRNITLEPTEPLDLRVVRLTSIDQQPDKEDDMNSVHSFSSLSSESSTSSSSSSSSTSSLSSLAVPVPASLPQELPKSSENTHLMTDLCSTLTGVVEAIKMNSLQLGSFMNHVTQTEKKSTTLADNMVTLNKSVQELTSQMGKLTEQVEKNTRALHVQQRAATSKTSEKTPFKENYQPSSTPRSHCHSNISIPPRHHFSQPDQNSHKKRSKPYTRY